MDTFGRRLSDETTNAPTNTASPMPTHMTTRLFNWSMPEHGGPEEEVHIGWILWLLHPRFNVHKRSITIAAIPAPQAESLPEIHPRSVEYSLARKKAISYQCLPETGKTRR
jgi:hypothetical protein